MKKLYNLVHKIYSAQKNKTEVIIRKPQPLTMFERTLKGNWENSSDEEVIVEVLRVVSMEFNPSEAILELESRSKKQENDVNSFKKEVESITTSLNESIEKAENTIEEINSKTQQISGVINEVSRQFMLSSELTGEQRAEIAKQYRGVGVGDRVSPNEVVNINGELFRMVQPSTITIDAENWLSDPSLFTPFLQTTIKDEETGEEIEVVQEFRQPEGAHDSYSIGDKVLFEGQVYESTIDANVWSPTANPQGWSLVVEVGEPDDEEPEETEPEETEDDEESEETEDDREPEPEPDPTEPEPTEPEDEEPEDEETEESEDETDETVEDFVAPSGGHNAYNTGDKVLYNGEIYESTIDSNVWSPSDYPQGWTLIE